MAYGIGTDYAHGERMDPPETGEDGDADTEKGDQVTDITDRARDLADKLRATSRHYNKLIDWEEHDLSDDQAAVLILAELQAERGECHWHETEYYWLSECGLEWVLEDAAPAANGMIYCPKCGRKLIDDSEEHRDVDD